MQDWKMREMTLYGTTRITYAAYSKAL